jgi:alpha-tubulin suppressor-like RCC1 family protein
VQGPGGVGFLNNVLTISAGQNNTLALKNDGTAWAWGRNDAGQIGNGTTTDALVPFQVQGPGGVGFLNNVSAVSVGEVHSLALLSDGTVRAWGNNDHGQLGDGSTTTRLTPVQVSGLTNVLAISAGGHFSVALKSDGTVWAWGSGQNGQIGDGGSPTNRSTPVQVKGPGGVGFLDNVLAISASQDHTLALKYNGTVATVWAWGYNGFGQIGDDTTFDALTSVPADGF